MANLGVRIHKMNVIIGNDAAAAAAAAAATSSAMNNLVAAAPTVCKPHHSTLETSLSLFLCMGLVVSYLPQIIRIILKRSSVGFSPWFLFLGATSSASSFLNVVSVQWAVVSCCQWLSTGACAESLLGIVQVGLQWLLFMTVFVLFLVYYPRDLRYERSIALSGGPDGDGEEDASDSSESDLDSIDSHIAENYSRADGDATDSSFTGASPSAVAEGAAASGVTADSSAGHSPDASGIASRITIDDDDEDDDNERSSSAFSRLVPTFWPVWKAPRKYAPSPLTKVVSTNGEQLPANATSQAAGAGATSSGSPSANGNGQASEANIAAASAPADHLAPPRVRLQVPTGLRRKRRRVKVRSPEWNLALSLAWLVAFHFVFALSVTLLLVSSLPSTSFPQPPQGKDVATIMGPSSRLLVSRWATFLGWSAMLLAAFQYLPQIVHTARARLVGSLSIPMMCLQVPGSAVFVYSLALRPGVNYTSLAAYVCTGILQSILLGLCVAWRIRERRLGIDDYGQPLVPESAAVEAAESTATPLPQ